jgi:hypothetical protein
MIDITYSERINYSLSHAGLQSVILSAALLGPELIEVSIAGYSNTMYLAEGRTENVSPTLDAAMFARLSAPVRSQLLIKRGGDLVECHAVTLSPLCAWDQHRAAARATAAFVLENDSLVGELIKLAGEAASASLGPRDAARRASLIYETLKRLFVPCYYYERNIFPGDEQAVRFPRQMKYDGGGTCVDFAFVYAAALYKAGLRPVVILLGSEFGPRHALVGFWATQRAAGTVLNPSELREAVGSGSLVPIEVTCVSSGGSFDDALREGKRATDSLGLLWGVDVDAARGEGIVSLPGKPSGIVIGGWDVRPVGEATATSTAAAAEMFKSMTVRVIESPDAADRRQSYELNSHRIRIGKHPHRDEVWLRARTVSDPHAVLFVRGANVYLEDLFSKNGTFLKGEQLMPHRPVGICPGDHFRVADVTLLLEARG